METFLFGVFRLYKGKLSAGLSILGVLSAGFVYWNV
jgi:hypothetical protein